jgi:hypothetical protein
MSEISAYTCQEAILRRVNKATFELILTPVLEATAA